MFKKSKYLAMTNVDGLLFRIYIFRIGIFVFVILLLGVARKSENNDDALLFK